MKLQLAAVLCVAALATGCSTFTTPRYSISAESNVALKAINAMGVGVGAFSYAGPGNFDNFCRGAGPLEPVDGISHVEYIRRAIESELKVAGAHAETDPRVTLTGKVTTLSFSSTRGLTGGNWNIGLTVASSNGQILAVSESYDFQSGFVADTACKQTAEAYAPAVQNLVTKLVRDKGFAALLR